MTVVIKSSRLKYLLLLLVGLGFVITGILMLGYGKPADRLAAWTSIVFFGACSLVFIGQLIDRRARLVIDEQGIVDRTLGVAMIPWSEITGAYMKSIKNNDFICLELRNPQRWLEKLSPLRRAMTSANKALGFSELSLNLSGIDTNTNEIYELVIKMIALQKIKKDQQ